MENSLLIPDWSNNTILIAEDMDNNFAVLDALLKKTQIKLIRACNGAEAINIVSAIEKIDLILMDVSMPEIDGIEATRIIRKLFPEKVVIAQTAHELSPRISSGNFNEVLQKPIQQRLLIDTLRKYLS